MELSVAETGLEVLDLRADTHFAARRIHNRDPAEQMAGLQRLSHALLERPESILQELVNAAVELCGADSAGISIVRENATDAEHYHWVATAGAYSGFLGAVLPRYPSACGLTLDRHHAQHFTVGKKFFDILGVEAPLVTDGILLPWETEETRGTIFVMSHDRTEAFDANDARLMEMLADFAAMGYKQQKQHAQALEDARLLAAARMAHDLAHKINNPLQSMTNSAFLMSNSADPEDLQLRSRELAKDIERLSGVVKDILALPFDPLQKRS